MATARVLFVDDEAPIRAIIPEVLKLHGYETVVAATVTEALTLITSQKFDVLISDLNMGHVADGFTVVSAMRRVNPDCINFILTGYPAFESALQALRAQVDDYLTKPSDIPKLVENIERRLGERPSRVNRPERRLSHILRENIDQILTRVREAMKAQPELAALPLSDEERTYKFSATLKEIADWIESEDPIEGNEALLRTARDRGEIRRLQGYPIELLVLNERIAEQVINNVIYENLLSLNLSFLLLDLARLNDALLLQLQESIQAYVRADRPLS